MEQISRVVEKHEIKLNSNSGQAEKTEEMAKAVLSKVKQSINKSGGSNEIYEHILKMKLEIKDIK